MKGWQRCEDGGLRQMWGQRAEAQMWGGRDGRDVGTQAEAEMWARRAEAQT